MKDQYDRRGGFIRIFPRAETWSAYGGLLGENVFQIVFLKKITPCKISFQEEKRSHKKLILQAPQMTQEISKDLYKECSIILKLNYNKKAISLFRIKNPHERITCSKVVS